MSYTSQDSVVSNETFGKDASFKLPQLIGSMSISPSGRDVVLGSKEGLHVIDLDSPYSPPRFLPHRTSWEVADVQWSPFADRDYWVVSTSNQKALVWNLQLYGWRNSIEHVLHGHTRAITDINFSAHHPDKLATCAVDSFVHCWDLRCPERPVTSFSDWFAGATQVKWSRQDEHVIASSHNKFLHIWDNRKGAYPARTIEAHDTKVCGIDWNRYEPSKIVTCSLDRTIKFWDTNNEEDIPERVIETSFPVWRARHTPFGWGLMVMPQRGNGDLHLYDRRAINEILENGRTKPVHVFPGHKGQVKEFLWRFYGTVKDGIDHRDFQLVSWGTDRELRLHAVSKDIFEDVGYERGVSKPHRLRFTRRGAKYRTFRDEPTEQDATFAIPSRTDSFPSSNQFLRVRGRLSTNMGMSRLHLNYFKSGVRGNKFRKTDMHGKGAGRPDTDPISWMKNVKIASWDPDALADEVTQVDEKFKNVDFETIDLSQRRVTMSLQSSWGEDESSSAYTRIDFKFPKGYPRDAQAIVYVQKTNSISPAIQQQLTLETRQIAEAHKTRGHGCIEAIVRYLLKEQTLDQIIQWALRDPLSDSKIIVEADMQQDVFDDSDDEQMVQSTNVAQLNAEFKVPEAKGCAAMWAGNGKLVCFFAQKAKEPASLLTALGTGRLDESESGKLFGGFGKFHVDSPSRKAKGPAISMPDDSSLDDSDHSSVFSTSSSSSDSSIGFEDRSRFLPWQRTTLNSLQRTKSGDGSHKSVTLDGTKADGGVRRANVCIYDFSQTLCASQGAAQEYELKETWERTFDHHYNVAMKYSLTDAAQIWHLARSLIAPLSSDKMSEALDIDTELSLLTKRVRASLAEVKHDTARNSDSLTNLWVGSSLLQRNLLPALFQFFERCADVQMLAVISAMFLQWQQSVLPDISMSGLWHPPSDSVLIDRNEKNARTTRDTGQRHKTSEDDSQAPSIGQDFGTYSLRPLEAAGMSSSVPNSSIRTGRLNSTQPSSGAPSVIAHDPSGFVSTVHSSTASLAGSPEGHRISRHSGFSSAVANLQALVRSRPASPPEFSARSETTRLTVSSKSARASPDDNFLNEARSKLRTSLSLANVSSYGAETNRAQAGRLRTQANARESANVPQVPRSRKKKKLKTKMFGPLDTQSSCLPDPFTEICSEDLCRRCLGYVRQYIPMLEVWRLWAQRAELLKLCAQIEEMLRTLYEPNRQTANGMTRHQGLETRQCCPKCEKALVPTDQNSIVVGLHCPSATCQTHISVPSKRQVCAICEVVITRLSVPCLQCGHLTCYECAEGWFGKSYIESMNMSRHNSTTMSQTLSVESSKIEDAAPGCPTGCGCKCSLVTDVAVPEPDTTLNRVREPTTPRSEGYPETSNPASVIGEHQGRGHRGQSISGATGPPESALQALLALQNQARHKSTSSNVSNMTASKAAQESNAVGRRTRDNSISAVDELLPWATDKSATLSKGRGWGPSRGLSNKGSDSTIRKSVR